MTESKFQVDGFADLNKALLDLGPRTGSKVLRRAGRRAMAPVEDAMRRGAKKDSGDLQDSIGMASSSSKGKSADRIARITVGPIKKTSGKGEDKRSLNNLNQKAIAQEYGNAKQSAQPFIRPALENNQQKVINSLIDEFAKELLKSD
ncbi:HK97-gp10 family putative phage morphogenesis protein [Microbulbifer sp. PSTR4-B]|uniref:HK97-gp10 family putative phage morphogenesis protein n=1 Tax=Microbulbifer sp. PSTR4-B TaxID=3243396 RepID=UPI004038FDAF